MGSSHEVAGPCHNTDLLLQAWKIAGFVTAPNVEEVRGSFSPHHKCQSNTAGCLIS